MNTIRNCGCKGVRTCLQCEKEYQIEKESLSQKFQNFQSYVYCSKCELFYPGWSISAVCTQHPTHDGEGLKLPGIYVKDNFLTAEEGSSLMDDLDALPWTISQSGRRKQNYGPKTNFKKRKLKLGSFVGFPAKTQFIQERLNNVEVLKNFQTIEQCSLEYEPKKGACIDPHIDDCWIWGERVVTVNCLGDAVLTLTAYEDTKAKYNLNLVQQYEHRLLHRLLSSEELSQYGNCVFRVPMPNLSLIVLFGPSRYQFEHAVLRDDILERRVCIAYREFTPMYVDGEHKDEGQEVTVQARHFWVPEIY